MATPKFLNKRGANTTLAARRRKGGAVPDDWGELNLPASRDAGQSSPAFGVPHVQASTPLIPLGGSALTPCPGQTPLGHDFGRAAWHGQHSEQWSFCIADCARAGAPVVVASPGFERLALMPRRHFLGKDLGTVLSSSDTNPQWVMEKVKYALQSVTSASTEWSDFLVVNRRSNKSTYTNYVRLAMLNVLTGADDPATRDHVLALQVDATTLAERFTNPDDYGAVLAAVRDALPVPDDLQRPDAALWLASFVKTAPVPEADKEDSDDGRSEEADDADGDLPPLPLDAKSQASLAASLGRSGPYVCQSAPPAPRSHSFNPFQKTPGPKDFTRAPPSPSPSCSKKSRASAFHDDSTSSCSRSVALTASVVAGCTCQACRPQWLHGPHGGLGAHHGTLHGPGGALHATHSSPHGQHHAQPFSHGPKPSTRPPSGRPPSPTRTGYPSFGRPPSPGRRANGYPGGSNGQTGGHSNGRDNGRYHDERPDGPSSYGPSSGRYHDERPDGPSSYGPASGAPSRGDGAPAGSTGVYLVEFRHTQGNFQPALLRAPGLSRCAEPRHIPGGPLVFVHDPDVNERVRAQIQSLYPRHVLVEAPLLDHVLEAAMSIAGYKGRKVNERDRRLLQF